MSTSKSIGELAIERGIEKANSLHTIIERAIAEGDIDSPVFELIGNFRDYFEVLAAKAEMAGDHDRKYELKFLASLTAITHKLLLDRVRQPLN